MVEANPPPCSLSAIESELRRTFDAAADEVNLDFRRQLSDLRGRVPQYVMDSAIRALREWREAKIAALRRDLDEKRRAARHLHHIGRRRNPLIDRGGPR